MPLPFGEDPLALDRSGPWPLPLLRLRRGWGRLHVRPGDPRAVVRRGDGGAGGPGRHRHPARSPGGAAAGTALPARRSGGRGGPLLPGPPQVRTRCRPCPVLRAGAQLRRRGGGPVRARLRARPGRSPGLPPARQGPQGFRHPHGRPGEEGGARAPHRPDEGPADLPHPQRARGDGRVRGPPPARRGSQVPEHPGNAALQEERAPVRPGQGPVRHQPGGAGVVVEGYTDVIAFHLADLPLAVATCGTALGKAHFDLLHRFSRRIVLAFDADAAGAGAAVRGDELRLTSDLDLDLRLALMPEGRDPADLVFDGKGDLLREAINGSAPLMEFRLNRLLGQYNLREREERTPAMQKAAELIATHPDAEDRYQHALYVTARTYVDIDRVQAEIERNLSARGEGRSQGRSRTTGRPVSPRLAASVPTDQSERDVLRHLMAGTAERDRVNPNVFGHDQAAELANQLLEEGRHLDKGVPVPLDGLKDQALAALARSLALSNAPLLPFEDAMSNLERRAVMRHKNELRVMLEGIDQIKEPEAYSNTLAELIALQERGF